ncbi:MAG TPA: hypothetical protein V6D04_11200 [Candidatus Obscuribacterales bacterium]
MLQLILHPARLCLHASLLMVGWGWLASEITFAQQKSVASAVRSMAEAIAPNSVSVPEPAPSMLPSSVQLDPLNSPYPVPWSWVLANLSAPPGREVAHTQYYRSPSLLSPDGRYATYSRIQMQISPDFTQSRVSSVLFLENLRSGDLRTITASSPLAMSESAQSPQPTHSESAAPGTIAILIPIAWSETGDRLLAREFESIFGSDIASDYAVIWDSRLNRTRTVAPTRIQYTNAVLLGWSRANPEQILFRVGNIGDPQWPLWTVDLSGQTTAAPSDRPQVFGRFVNSIWTGPQAQP